MDERKKINLKAMHDPKTVTHKNYVDVQTTEGHRYLTYKPLDYDSIKASKYVHHGLGSYTKNGQWHIIERNLQTDLQKAQPHNNIVQINNFIIRGSGFVDNISLRSD